MAQNDFHIVIIGGGGTGVATMYDLAKRGFKVTLVERGELTCGTTGRHHGQLHCGARYAMGDKNIAHECLVESKILRKIAPNAIEYNMGMFVALDDNDMQYRDKFISDCLAAEIPAQEIPISLALEYEKELNPKIKTAVLVPDGTIDPWRLVISFAASALKTKNANIKTYSEVISIDKTSNYIKSIKIKNHVTNKIETISGDLFINATGAWANQITDMVDIDLDVTPSPGTMLAAKGRITNMVVSRLHKAGDGDIVVPQRQLSIIGSTQWISKDPDIIVPYKEDMEFLKKSAKAIFPNFDKLEYHTAWAAARPLFGNYSTDNDVRELSRDFRAIDHANNDNINNFISIVGGKATTLRAMGEVVSDMVCSKVGIDEKCTTSETELDNYRNFYRGGFNGSSN
ncbi:MAG: FAD-dependent oxidoreductase [Sphaerochaetaceae bacterium]|nr:FAD-dependent oxidoreductase [Sphaerochaetaceae bacterium]